MKITEWLKLPETKNIQNLDDASTTILHGKIIQKKPFLKRVYIDYYNQFKKSVPNNIEDKILIELGSGGGFLKEIIPNVITSDILDLPDVDKCFSGLRMPFEKNSIDAFFMIDVLHHINNSRLFFKELDRCLKVGGKVVMIEPANTLLGGFIFRNFHHEPFDTKGGWGLKGDGPLSSANMAIPWIIFYRDRKSFINDFPSLRIKELRPHTPFRYLLSGGVSMRQLLPTFSYNLVKGFETIISPFNRYLGMFYTIEIEKVS
jgi:SAM-dependent methyltransferase